MKMNSLAFGLWLLVFASVSEAQDGISIPKAVKSLKHWFPPNRWICPGGKFITMDLISSSASKDNFVRTTVKNVAAIRSMHLLSEKSPKGTCKVGETCDFIGPDVFVNEGCKGHFKICVIPGSNCEAICKSFKKKPKVCVASPAGSVIRSIGVVNQWSVNFCVEGISFGTSGNTIWVRHGCKARFIVGYTDPDGK